MTWRLTSSRGGREQRRHHSAEVPVRDPVLAGQLAFGLLVGESSLEVLDGYRREVVEALGT